MINWTGPYGASQQSTQRFGSLPTLRDAKMYVFLKRNCRQLYDAKKYIIISFLWNLSLHHEVWLIKNSKYQYIHFLIYIYIFFRALMLQSVGLIVIVTSACMTGVAVFAYYAMKGCDPLTNGDIMSSNQVRNLYSFLKKKNVFRLSNISTAFKN